MAWFRNLFSTKKSTVQTVGICDLCSGRIEYEQGFVFYSQTVLPRLRQETGLMHICGACCARFITDDGYDTVRKQSKFGQSVDEELINQLTPEKLANLDFDFARKSLRIANSYGIIKSIVALGIDLSSAKDRAHELSIALWRDREDGVSQALRFWKHR